jgi:DNA recombination protein RmuC
MEIMLLSIAIGVLVAGFAAVLYFIRQQAKAPEMDDKAMLLLQSQINELARNIDSKLGESRQEMQKSVHTQFSESQKLLHEISSQMQKSLVDVTREQTRTNEATQKFMSIAEQLANLERVLKHQKQRGNLGEASLELILSNMLPPGGYKSQYSFKNGETVDAVIITRDGFIPVDAKFSLDNYNRITQAVDDRQREELEKEFKADLKKRIDETAKYIRPNEGTLPFAFMFIPAEGIYYDLLVNEVNAAKISARNLIDYAYNEKHVVIVSPTTFAAYLQSVLYGFKAYRIEETAKDIIKRVDELGKHLKAYDEYVQKMGNSLQTTVNHFNASYKELKKVDKDVLRITGEGIKLDPVAISGPVKDEE